MNFDFLKNTVLNKVEEQKTSTRNGRTKIQRNPDNGADLRVFKDGSVYPSIEAMDKYNLEYNKEKTGNGFDVFSSQNWTQYPTSAPNVIFISQVPKVSARIDLFGSAREVDGELTSVLSQGSKTFGTQLIEMLQNTYGVELFQDQKYVDLQIVDDVTLPTDGISYIPKMVVKGEHAGTLTTERRENSVIHPLAIYQAPTQEDIEVGKEVEQEEPELV